MDKEDQYSFNLFDDIKIEPEIGNSPTMQNEYCLEKPRTLFKNDHSEVLGDNTTSITSNDFEYQTTEQFASVDIKEEIIECEMPKFEQHSDFPTKINQATVSEKVQMFPESIKQELKNTCDVKVTDIKQEISEYIQPKTESVVCELLTSECNLPTLKVESTDYYHDNYFGHSSRPLKNTSRIIVQKKRKYECPICQNNFPSSKSRSTHIDGHFEKRYTVCHFCGRLMKKTEFFQHFFIHVVKNRFKNHINYKSFQYNLFSKKLKSKNFEDFNNKSFNCSTYFKTINIKSKLQKQIIIYSGEKPFNCDICSKGFAQKQYLQRHLLVHMSKKSYKCDICFKKFDRNYDLLRHLLIHSGKKLFKCEKCFKCFTLKSHLRQHILFHGGEKPFKCDICFKGFTQKSCLQRHLLIHSGEKAFKCDVCSKVFNRKFNLQEHLKIHSTEKPFKCDICSKCFTRKTNLQRHLLIHSGEKPFQCDICSKCFTLRTTLQKHLLIHRGEK